MVNIDNYMGRITFSEKYLSEMIRYTASSCFGVMGLNPPDKLHNFFKFLKKGAYNDKGVALEVKNGKLNIAVHITVLYGTNISALSDNLAHKIKFSVEEKTGIQVGKITVFVDGIRE